MKTLFKFQKTTLIVTFAGIIISSTACKKLITAGSPKSELTPDKVYADTGAVKSVISNIYANFERNIYPTLQLSLGLYADELNYYGQDSNTAEFYLSKVSPGNQRNLNIWSRLYNMIYQCNDVLEQLSKADWLPTAFKQRISGETYFLRAFAYFHLVNLYEHIPLILQTDVNLTSRAAQVPPESIYAQIEKDLTVTKDLLQPYPKAPLSTKVDKYAATALLSKVYLYQKKWQQASSNATELISSGNFELDDLENTFKASSRETIFQFWTPQGYNYTSPELILSASNAPQYALNSKLAAAFENGDQRKQYWTDLKIISDGSKDISYSYPTKYTNISPNNGDPEYLTAFRLAEQYLIQAEAKTEQGDFDGALAALNTVRKRASLGPLPQLNSAEDYRLAILKESRLELFMEGANRFFELKRTGQLNAVMGVLKPSWLTRAKNLPIPRSEMVANPGLIQNQDY